MAEADDKTIRPEDEPTAVAPEEPTRPDEAAPVEPPVAPVNRRGGFLGPVVGGVLAAAAGFGLAQYVPDGWPLQDTSALDQQLGTQSEMIAALEARLAAFEGAKVPDIQPLMDTLATLNGRVAALETGPAERVEDMSALRDSLAALQAQVQGLANAPAGQTTVQVPANITALAAEAEARLKEAEQQADAMKAQAEALTRAAIAQAALGRLRAAVDTGVPFAAILPDLGLEVPESLSAHAETGLPSLPALQSSFADAARQALEAALRADMGDSWTERATSFFRSQTGARSLTPREGTDPDAILSRAEAALAGGNLDLTLQELSSLPDAAQQPLETWRALAAARRDALRALDDVAGKIGG